ncbi:unnamed protein product [Paramecium sonneborni]|uniref:Uncharacterized protein n=1 Tax=Paramecium sonneborni TaxID=65129 RepID=A0A8S1KD74_9CILI|nr:unnamed protein product [Paramecium sonneborni]
MQIIHQSIDKIDQLNRIIIKGKLRDFLMLQIRQVITDQNWDTIFLIIHYQIIFPFQYRKQNYFIQFDISDQIIVDKREVKSKKQKQIQKQIQKQTQILSQIRTKLIIMKIKGTNGKSNRKKN